MSELKSFFGEWEVEDEHSGSIEPLLRAFHVRAELRAEALAVKFAQHIDTSKDGQVLRITNTSKHGSKTDRYSLRKKDLATQWCTFNSTDTYPLTISSKLPKMPKSRIIDQRRLCGDDPNRFEQRLTLKRSGKDDIIIIRHFRRRVSSPIEVIVEQHGKVVKSNLRFVAVLLSLVAGTVLQMTYTESDPYITYAAAILMSVFLALSKTSLISAQPGGTSGKEEVVFNTKYSNYLWLAVVLTLCLVTVSHKLNTDYSHVGVVVSVVLFAIIRIATITSMAASGWDHSKVTKVALIFGGCIAFVYSLDRIGKLFDTQIVLKQVVVCVTFLIACGYLSTMLHSRNPQISASFPFLRLDTIDQNDQSSDEHGNNALNLGISVKVCEYETNSSNQYALFKILVECAGAQWTVRRRFREFDELRRSLRKEFDSGVLPQLPPKSMGRNLTKKFLEERREQLDDFLVQLLSESLFERTIRKSALQTFLNLQLSEERLEEVINYQKSNGGPQVVFDESLIPVLQKARKICDDACSVDVGDGWTDYGTKKGVKCFLKKQGDLTYTKGYGMVRAPLSVILGFFADPSKRLVYDDLHNGEAKLAALDLEKYSEALGAKVDYGMIVWSDYKSPFPLAVAPRDVVTCSFRVNTLDDKENGGIFIYTVSVDGYKGPVKGRCRAKVIANGMLFYPRGKDKVYFKTCGMIDPTGSIPSFVVNSIAPEKCMFPGKLDTILQDRKNWPDPLPDVGLSEEWAGIPDSMK